MIGVQILGILFVLIMTYFTFLHYKRKEISIVEYAMWQALWLGMLVIVIIPGKMSFLLQTFKFIRLLDFVTIAGMAVLFGIIFRNYVIINRLEKRIERFIRDHAIHQSDRSDH